MIVTESGVDPKVSAVVYVAARAPDAGEDYHRAGQNLPYATRFGRHCLRWRRRTAYRNCVPTRFRRYAVQQPFHKALLTGKTKHAAWRS